MHEPSLTGVFVPIITPFTPTGSCDGDALRRLAGRLLDEGAAGLVALGTTGEAPLLVDSERETIVDVCLRSCQEHGAPLIVGAGSSGTACAVEAVSTLSRPELAALLCVVPAYLRPTQAGIVSHFEQVADASPVPIVIYNVPHRTGIRADAPTLLYLAEHENIVGVKQSAGAIDNDTLELISRAPRGFAVLAGEDTQLAALAMLGAAGGITASAHLCTSQWIAMLDAVRAGDLPRARKLHERLLPLAAACFAEPNPGVIKAALHANGEIATPDLRLPFLPAASSSVQNALTAQAFASRQ